MIARDPDEARKIANDRSVVNDFRPHGSEVAALCSKLLETVVDPEFPGALVPTLSAEGALSVFVVAPTMADWRRLSPVLRAFAGPTFTSFDGLARELPQDDPTSVVVALAQPAATGVMHLPDDVRSAMAALRALVRARETLARAPSLQRSAPEPTSWLIARFQDCLNVSRIDAAREILARLKSELRLDALNLKFLEVQLLAAFGDWRGIVELPGFANLCVARRTPVVTSLLLEALYQVHLSDSFDNGAAEETRGRYEQDVRRHARPMLTVPASPTLSTAGWRICGLEAWVDNSRLDIRVALNDRLAEVGWIAGRLAPVASAEEVAANSTRASLDDARLALVRVDAVESLDSVTAALAALERLSPEELARLREAEPFKAALNAAEEAQRVGLPSSWIAWLSMAEDPSFISALEIARRGKDEWPVVVGADDPVAVQSFVAGLYRAFSNDLAAERTAQALPFLVAWLRRDPDFPRAAMAPIYSSLLTLFALSNARGQVTYESTQVLVSASLSVGMHAKAYRELISDVEALAGGGFGVNMIYWMLEVVEDFLRASAPDPEARECFLHRALARISPIFARLTSFQQAATARLARELGWTLERLGIDAEAGKVDDLASCLRGMRIAIYSLSESASRQAKATIEELQPAATVDCNADHVGTVKLKALAEGADIFVMTSLSAKHAATDFIRVHRASRPLLYAQGRGFSSILRAIEDHFSINTLVT